MAQKKASKEQTPPNRQMAFQLTLGAPSRASEARQGGDSQRESVDG